MTPSAMSQPHQLIGAPGKPKRLVILAPGFHSRLEQWQPLRDRLEREREFSPERAKWIAFDHQSQVYSTGTVDRLGRRLNALIVAEDLSSGPYDDIVLIGHSMGGLIVRHAYLVGNGSVLGESAADWSSRVSRIVLMASVNRGLDISKWAPAEIVVLRTLAYFARVLPWFPAFLALDLCRGSTFLTNLRINWIRCFGSMRSAAADVRSNLPNRAMPLVVQVLGTNDSLVSADDSKDVLAFPEGHYVEVPDADHSNLFRLDTARDADLRYAVLRRALAESFATREDVAPDPVKRVVFLLHGIRASNVDQWVEGLEECIKAREGASVTVAHPTYGYFSAARFALPTVRKKNIGMFQDWYTEELAKHPAAQFDIIAHSNGTYILGNSLLKTAGMRFTNVVLAGSVLPQNFWEEFPALERQVGRIRNDRANRDWPVALLCNALAGIGMRDVGTGGFAGFDGNRTEEVAYYSGGHGEVLKVARWDMLVDFALGAPVSNPGDLSGSPGYYRQLSRSMPYLAKLLLIVILAGVGWFVFGAGEFNLHRALGVLASFIAAYAILDII